MAAGAVLRILRHLLFGVSEVLTVVNGVTGVLVRKALYKMEAAITAVVLEPASLWRETTGDRHLQSRAGWGLTRACA
jgi:hypothetical protein